MATIIRSKVDAAEQTYRTAIADVVEVIATKRGTAEARRELDQLRVDMRVTGKCAYCGRQVNFDTSPRHLEACKKCGRHVDYMLQLKSKVLAGDIDSIRPMLKGYSQFVVHTPYALRGANGSVDDVVAALQVMDVAASNYRIELKAARRREAERFVVEQEKAAIRDILVQCGMTLGSEELEQRVDEIYYERHTDQ